jgi:hypothetical protein
MDRKVKLAKKQAKDIEIVACSNSRTSLNLPKDKHIVVEDANSSKFEDSTNVVVVGKVKTSHNIENHVTFQYIGGGFN